MYGYVFIMLAQDVQPKNWQVETGCTEREHLQLMKHISCMRAHKRT